MFKLSMSDKLRHEIADSLLDFAQEATELARSLKNGEDAKVLVQYIQATMTGPSTFTRLADALQRTKEDRLASETSESFEDNQ